MMSTSQLEPWASLVDIPQSHADGRVERRNVLLPLSEVVMAVSVIARSK